MLLTVFEDTTSLAVLCLSPPLPQLCSLPLSERSSIFHNLHFLSQPRPPSVPLQIKPLPFLKPRAHFHLCLWMCFPSDSDALPSLGAQLQLCLALPGRASYYLWVTIVTTHILCSVTLMALISSYRLLTCLLDFSSCLVYGVFSISIATLL